MHVQPKYWIGIRYWLILQNKWLRIGLGLKNRSGMFLLKISQFVLVWKVCVSRIWMFLVSSGLDAPVFSFWRWPQIWSFQTIYDENFYATAQIRSFMFSNFTWASFKKWSFRHKSRLGVFMWFIPDARITTATRNRGVRAAAKTRQTGPEDAGRHHLTTSDRNNIKYRKMLAKGERKPSWRQRQEKHRVPSGFMKV